jgi:hypothetical protein
VFEIAYYILHLLTEIWYSCFMFGPINCTWVKIKMQYVKNYW